LVERPIVFLLVALAKRGLAHSLTIPPIILARAWRVYRSKALGAFNNTANLHLPIALARSTIRDSISLVFVFLPAKIFIVRTG
jgi:hypothetical protein